MSLAAFLGAVGSFVRVQEFLKSPERCDMREVASPSSSKPSVDPENEHAISVEGASFGWDTGKSAILKNVTLHVPWGKLTTVVGPVGCGKSTLLHALLGEIPFLSNSSGDGHGEKTSTGAVRLGSSSVAYCSQNPWHMNGTVREAIVGADTAARFDEKWYARVVSACALRRDFDQLPRGDASPIGSGGIALSGGQSQRIALARAVYARRKIVILDDVLSGLDLGTENAVFHGLFGERGLFREVGSSVLMVSSSGMFFDVHPAHELFYGVGGTNLVE